MCLFVFDLVVIILRLLNMDPEFLPRFCWDKRRLRSWRFGRSESNDKMPFASSRPACSISSLVSSLQDKISMSTVYSDVAATVLVEAVKPITVQVLVLVTTTGVLAINKYQSAQGKAQAIRALLEKARDTHADSLALLQPNKGPPPAFAEDPKFANVGKVQQLLAQ